jgi:hypothetical protein
MLSFANIGIVHTEFWDAFMSHLHMKYHTTNFNGALVIARKLDTEFTRSCVLCEVRQEVSLAEP